MAVEITGIAQRDAWRARVLPPVERVCPGLWSVPVPIPDNPLRYVLVYAFELPDGLAIVDSGWPVPEAWEALVSGLAEAGFRIADIRAVLVTHVHADHHGLSARIRAESGAWIGMHPLEAKVIVDRRDPEVVVERARDWVLERGGSPADAVELTGTAADLAPFLDLATPDRYLEDGDRPLGDAHPIRAVWTPGHTPGHLCFHDEAAALLLSGDHILPRISPNISLQPGQAPNPLADFLSALDATATLDTASTEVLPAHEYRFTGLRVRVDELKRHHAERLTEIERVIGDHGHLTTWELAQLLTWSRPWTELRGYIRRSAVAETLAHLAYLERAGRVARLPEPVDQWRITGTSGPGAT